MHSPLAWVTGTTFCAVARRSSSRLVTISCRGFRWRLVITEARVRSRDCRPLPHTSSTSSASTLMSPTPARSRSSAYLALILRLVSSSKAIHLLPRKA